MEGEPPSVAARARARGEARANSSAGDLRLATAAGDLAGEASGAGDFTMRPSLLTYIIIIQSHIIPLAD